MNKKLVLLGAGLLLTAATASAQQHVTGKVTDSHGEPIMGATVRVAGTKIITTTNANGTFKLTNVPASAKKIQVSYIGMESKTLDVAGNVEVVLKDNELGEVVVVGYGTGQKLGTVVGSVKKVGSEQIADKPVPNVADALQGKVAGLSVSTMSGDVGDVNQTAMKLRGTGSLGSSNAPLIVIDGSPANSAMFQMLNDNDIESITTLKDASATSIYGSRAANGVIYITTKKGRANEKAQITVGQTVGWSQLARGIGDPMNSNELLQFQLENGIITTDQYTKYKLHGANTNWQKYLFDNAAPMYNTDFSIRGGSGNTTYFVSASYMKQKSLTKVSHFDRYTVRTNLDTKPKDWLTFGVRQSIAYTDRASDLYTNESQMGGGNAALGAILYPSYWDPYTEGDKPGLYWGSTMYHVPYIMAHQPSSINDIVYNGTAYAQITPVKGLTLKSQLALNAFDTRLSENVLPSHPLMQGTGQASESHSRSAMWTITNTAEYKIKIADKHNLTLLAGQEGIKYSSKGFDVMGKGTTDDRLPTLGNVTSGEKPGYSSAKYEYLSFFGRVDYNFNDKYFLNFTIRNDQSSRFGANNRGANFYSGGLMWNITSEDFMSSTRGWLTNLQFKATVGSTGNSEIGNYTSLGLTGQTQYGGQPGWVLAQPANTELGWEKQVQTNVGLTARLFDRLSVDFNFYHRKTLDMLLGVPLPTTTGFSSQSVNVGELSNRGVELELSYDVVNNRDFYFNVYANYAFNKNKVDELFYGLKEWPMPDYLLNYTVGKSLEFYMPIYAGVDKNDGAPMWYKPGFKGEAGYDYNPETMTKTYSDDLAQLTGKSQDAPHNGGFGFTASWKGLSLNADFAFSLKKYMVNNDMMFAASSHNAAGGNNQDKSMLHIWKRPGDLAELPGFQYLTQFDTHLLENSSYLRLKNLTLSYDLPKQWMEATNFFDNIRFTFTARNVFTVTKYKGADPEAAVNLSRGRYPATRNFTLGVDLSF